MIYAQFVSGLFFFFQAEDGIRDTSVTGVQTCALPISTIVTRAISEPTGSGIGRSNEARSTRPSAAAAAAQNCIENFRSSAVVGAGWMSTLGTTWFTPTSIPAT